MINILSLTAAVSVIMVSLAIVSVTLVVSLGSGIAQCAVYRIAVVATIFSFSPLTIL